MKFLKLTWAKSESRLLVNTEAIVSVHRREDGCSIVVTTGSMTYEVEETPEQILAMLEKKE